MASQTCCWSTSFMTKLMAIGLMSRVFPNGQEDQGSIQGQVIPKTQKMVLDATWLSTQHYKVRIKRKVEQSKEWSSTLPLHLSVVAIEKGASGSPSTKVTNFTYLQIGCWEKTRRISWWLFSWVLWHINLCRLFNTKSIFIQIINSISNNSV